METLSTFSALPAHSRGAGPLDADATGALARLASDVQVVERAIGHRFPAGAVVACFNRALQIDAALPTGAWTDFYLTLARFLNVASMVATTRPSADALAAFWRLQEILADDFGQLLLAAPEHRRLKRRLRRLSEPAVPHVS